jgi:hypothetical protein
MKKYILYKIAKYATRSDRGYSRSRWPKKIKLLLVFLFFGTIVIGGAGIWGAVTIVQQIAGSVSPSVAHQKAMQGESLLKEITSQPLVNQECLATISSFFSGTRLLTEPLATSAASIKSACWADANTSKTKTI